MQCLLYNWCDHLKQLHTVDVDNKNNEKYGYFRSLGISQL